MQAIKNKEFALEADRVTFKRGRIAYVTSNTNFILLNGDRASVQIAFNGAFAGPNTVVRIEYLQRTGILKLLTLT